MHDYLVWHHPHDPLHNAQAEVQLPGMLEEKHARLEKLREMLMEPAKSEEEVLAMQQRVLDMRRVVDSLSVAIREAQAKAGDDKFVVRLVDGIGIACTTARSCYFRPLVFLSWCDDRSCGTIIDRWCLAAQSLACCQQVP